MGLRDSLKALGLTAAGAAFELAQTGLSQAEEFVKASRTNQTPDGVDKDENRENQTRTPAQGGDKAAAAAGEGAVPTEKDQNIKDPDAMFWDPFAIIEQLGYKERPTQISYGTLRAILYRMPIITDIILTRIDQMASFAKPQRDRYGMGFRLKLRDSEKEPTNQDKQWISDMESLIMHTGVCEDPRYRDDFETFIRKLMWDSLRYDQMAFEVVPNRKGQPSQWYAVDASTFRLADTSSAYMKKKLRNNTRYVQIYDGMIIAEYEEPELCFGVRNPRTDIHLFGYGTSELEWIMTTITNLLWGFKYNQNFFKQGSAPKGMINFKGAIPEAQLKGFRRHFYAMLSGVDNCICGDTVLWTSDGAQTIEKLVGLADQKNVTLWTGDGWATALAYKTKEKKRLARTKLQNGLTINTSEDHRFRVIGLDGEPTWKSQRDLELGDFVLVNKKVVEFPTTSLPTYKDKPVSTGLLEALGWLVGDGYLSFEGRGHQKTNCARWFYHPEKERDICEKHCRVLADYDPAATIKEHTLSDKDVEYLLSHYGFKTVQRTRLSLDLFSVDFVDWLISFGFTTSREGKTIPSVLYRLPGKYRAAFLRGLFSADGNCAKRRSPAISIINDRLREQTKLLLLSLGIRTNLSEGKSKLVIDGCQRSYVEAPSVLRIRDKDAFFSQIGFIQKHKQPKPLKKPNEAGKRQLIAHQTVLQYLRKVRANNDAHGKTLLSKRERMDLNSILGGSDACSLPRLLRFMKAGKVEPPTWMVDYHFEPVVEKELTDSVVGMYDVEVYDDRHQFAASGIMTHNSWRTPIVNADEIQWMSMHESNKDMEFNAWLDFNIKIACAAFKMNPVEINFQYGNVGQRGALTESSNKEKITESKQRGLYPLLTFLAKQINMHIIWPTNPNFELEFVGLDATTQEETAKLNQTRVKTIRTVNELRAEDDLEPMDGELGDVILDPTWIQWAQHIQAQEQMGEEGGGFPGGFGGEEGGTADEGAEGEETPEIDFEGLFAEQDEEETPEELSAKAREKATAKAKVKAEQKGKVQKSLVKIEL